MTCQLTLYYFDELSEEAKKRALTQKYEFEGDSSLELQLKYRFTQYLARCGYPVDDICWSLNHCQGDGMAFYGAIPDLEVLARRLGFEDEAIDTLNKLGMKDAVWCIKRNYFGHRYSHEHTMEIDVGEFYNTSDTPNIIDKLEAAIKTDIVKLSQLLCGIGYALIDDYYSDENMINYALENELFFTERGKLFRL